MVLARFLPQLRFIEVIPGDGPKLDAPARLYQSLLSRDMDEARKRLDDHVRERAAVLTCDELILPAVLDALGGRMLRAALGRDGFEVDIGSDKMLLSEAIEAVARRAPDVVCIGSAPSAGLFFAKRVCRQLRRRYAALPVVAIHWVGVSRDGRERRVLFEAGASAVHGSIDELRLALVALRSAGRPAPVAEPVVPAAVAS